MQDWRVVDEWFQRRVTQSAVARVCACWMIGIWWRKWRGSRRRAESGMDVVCDILWLEMVMHRMASEWLARVGLSVGMPSCEANSEICADGEGDV